MIRVRKIRLLIFSLLLVVASFLFVACGKTDYSHTYLSSSVGEYVELYASTEKQLEITINNPVKDMNKGIVFTQSNPLVAQIKQIANQDSKTTFNITGLSGGKTNVEFVTIEGRKSFTLTIYVKEYSDVLSASDNGLYVSANKALEPTNSDFKFKESATEKDLEFYFYGKKNNSKTLTLDDITINDNLINGFAKVLPLYHSNVNQKDYLIFVDSNDQLFTLGKGDEILETGNIRYTFNPVELTEDGGYRFSLDNATDVTPGTKFTFLAKYVSESEEEGETILSCERDFSVIIDINREDFSYEFGYEIEGVSFVPGGSSTSYKLENLQDDGVILIPNYTTDIGDNRRANYRTAYAEIKVRKNSQLILNAKTRDTSVANSSLYSLPIEYDDDFEIYYVKINCGTGKASSTFFDMNFYYEGFENNKDENVNITYSIPIKVRIIPTALLINNVDFEQVDREYKFYDYYVSDYGWQEFNFSVIPAGAEYQSFTINLDGTNLKLRYRNVEYDSGEVEIDNLNIPVYIRGNSGNADGLQKELKVKMGFNIIKEDSLDSSIKYRIVKGVSSIDIEKNNIVLERYSEGVPFNQIYTNAEFSSVQFELESGKDVVSFSYDADNLCVKGDDNYVMNLVLTPKDIGTGTYTIILDNGKRESFTVSSREALKSLQFVSTNEDNSIKLMEEIGSGEDESYTLIYLLNKNGESYFDLRLVANNNINSSAISNVEIENNASSIVYDNLEDGRYLIYSRANGENTLTFKVTNYSISDFESTEVVTNFKIVLVTYSLAGDLYAYKLKDCYGTYESEVSANYVNVYTNAYSEALRTAAFDIKLKNADAFLFRDVRTEKFTASSYKPSNEQSGFLYFESDAPILLGNQYKNIMYYSKNQSNNYTLGSFGVFNTETLTFIASPNNKNSGRVKLLAHIMQYNKLYSYTININIEVYQEIERVTLQNTIEELNFSVLNPEESIIAFPTNSNATNDDITVLVTGGTLTDGDKIYGIFDEELVDGKLVQNITYNKSAGKTEIVFKVNSVFLEKAENYSGKISGTILCVAQDWLDSQGNLRSGYSTRAGSPIKFNFENGTEENRFSIFDAEDLLNVKQNLSAHYRIRTVVDASSISGLLPLGELKGSIIGDNEFSEITGITIDSHYYDDETSKIRYYGLFSSIAEGAYIEYVQFSGKFNLNSSDSTNYRIGLIAGENRGELRNVGVTINDSSSLTRNFAGKKDTYDVNFGAVVGINSGLIIQDFTAYEKGALLGKTPRIPVFMNDFINVSYLAPNSSDNNANIFVGGLAGLNTGTIKKIDSSNKNYKYFGYTNYIAYSKIKLNIINSNTENLNLENVYVGGVAGKSEGIIIGGVYKLKGEAEEFTPYERYIQDEDTGDFEAGKGIIVGGEIWGYGYVGGVAGKSDITDKNQFTGITTRALVRGQKKGTVTANIALFTNTSATELNSSFAVQATDSGKIYEESAMAVLYNNEVPERLKTVDNNLDLNRLGFGLGYDGSALNKDESGPYINVYSYVNRTDNYRDKVSPSSNVNVYYGDFLVVGKDNNSQNVIVFRGKFAKGDEKFLSVEDNFNNLLQPSSSSVSTKIFYAYYFEAESVIEGNVADIQTILDRNLNILNTNSNTYPFKTNGEMTFVSGSSDILTIDQTGRITLKGTGLVKITATSILNSNNALNFYIYVVNYFNSQSTVVENNDRKSIINSTISASQDPIDITTIELRGKNSATLYVVPDYTFDLQRDENNSILYSGFFSDSRGFSSILNVYFNLAANTEVTASVKVYKALPEDMGKEPDSEPDDQSEYEGYEEDENNIEIEIIGQTITIRSLSSADEGVYKLVITPILKVILGNEEFAAAVNKKLENVELDYKYGAIEIRHKNFDGVTIKTSKNFEEEIIIVSTDENEKEPLYYLTGVDKDLIDIKQGTISSYSENNGLFKVSLKGKDKTDLKNGTFEKKFSLIVRININSDIYKNRYDRNIYGNYLLHIQSSSNPSVFFTINIEFAKTNVTSVVIDNYTSLEEINDNKSLTSSSEIAHAGVNGLLAITINPDDSDFDFIRIENDAVNYTYGRSRATFNVLLRTSGDENMFTSSSIQGSLITNGLEISLSDILKAYNGENNVIKYNGILYIGYNMESVNVVDMSKSRINVTIYKEGNATSVSKEITVKILNYVAVEIDGKEGVVENGDYYISYVVARGLSYKLNLRSYGFRVDNISLVSSSSLGVISRQNGDYYLTITDGTINYNNNENIIELIASASQTDGETVRTARSKTKITIYEYVVNYDGETDIVTGMADGVINVQVGTQITFGIDIYDYIEYDSSIADVVNKVNDFMRNLTNIGYWNTITNLITDDQPDYRTAGSTSEVRKNYVLRDNSYNNYYFNSNDLSILPKRTHSPAERFYYFEFYANYEVGTNNGIYVASLLRDNDNQVKKDENKIKTTFVLNVYSSSSAESPLPIYDYSDLKNMQSGGYYILLNDITLPSTADEESGEEAFTPINGVFASFDGNGHSINFAGVYDMGTLSEIGLFSSIENNSVVKNLIVNYTAPLDGSDYNSNPNDKIYDLYNLRTVKFITTADSFVFGTIAAQNFGIITNCKVITNIVDGNKYYLTIKADNALRGSSYAGGLVGLNVGYITNCGVSINAKMPFNLAGVVAQNNKKIAACYFQGGELINNSQYDQHVSGFSISNSNDGQIITSYVSGAQDDKYIYSTDSNSFIISSLPSSGFIYENSGTIKDCYTNIDLSRTASDMAGFVLRNGGTIKNCFSLSKLISHTTASAGFAREDAFNGTTGSFENCYYYYHIKSGDDDEGDVNVSLYDRTFEGIEGLDSDGFGDMNNFKGYSYDNKMSTQAIWFFSQGRTSETFVDYVPTTEKIIIPNNDDNQSENGKNQSNTVYRTEYMTFGKNRLELVSPNVRVLSVRNFSYSELNEETNEIIYHYVDDTNAPNRGTLHNPRLIQDSQTMEDEILNQTGSNNINTTNYRILSDVNYVEFNGHSNLYRVIFAGNLEGNGMEINSIGLVYMDRRNNGGLFSQIGYSASKTGVVKNLTISPKEVIFNNTNNVGVLAGTLKYGYIYDITVDAQKYNLTTVSGLNFVGGIIGSALSEFEAKDIYSNVDVWSVYSSNEDNSYREGYGLDESNYSYAGGLIGFVGKGRVYNGYVENVSSIIGSRVGLAYGGIGINGEVENTFVTISQGLKLRANHYAGYIVGEETGTLTRAYVKSSGGTESSFLTIPKAPIAVGGIAGKLSGGTISEVYNSQSFRATNSEDTLPIEFVGGIIGLVQSSDNTLSYLRNCMVEGDLYATATLGGAVGGVYSSLFIDGAAVKSESLSVLGKRENPNIGGVVGLVGNSDFAALDMRNSYCNALLKINTYTAGEGSTGNAGGLIGRADRIPVLSYCYTTSTIEAEISDLRALGTATEFAGDDVSKTFGYSIYSSSAEDGEVVGDNVFYLGAGVKDIEGKEKKDLYNAVKNYVSFNVKANNLVIGLNVNNYGTDSSTYAKNLGSDGKRPSAFYNLYGSKYQYIGENIQIGETVNDVIKPGATGYYKYISEKNDCFIFNDVTKGADKVNITFERDQNAENQWKYEAKTIKLGDLLLNELFKGSDGNYYLKVYKRESGTKIGYHNLLTNEDINESDIGNISLKKVWIYSTTGLSSLAFEDEFNWVHS